MTSLPVGNCDWTGQAQGVGSLQGLAGMEALCTPPNPFDTRTQFDRFHHLDLPQMALAELDRERTQVLMGLALTGGEAPWFHERLARLEVAIEHRSRPQAMPLATREPDPETVERDGAREGAARQVASRKGPPLADHDIVRRMLSAKDGAHLRALWQGDHRAYAGPSEARAALRRRLLWWCQGNGEQADRLVRQSGLGRQV